MRRTNRQTNEVQIKSRRDLLNRDNAIWTFYDNGIMEILKKAQCFCVVFRYIMAYVVKATVDMVYSM